MKKLKEGVEPGALVCVCVCVCVCVTWEVVKQEILTVQILGRVLGI